VFLDETDAEESTADGPTFSDRWYIWWWNALMNSREGSRAGSAENARSLGQSACDAYRKESQLWSLAFSKPAPPCSTMLATDKVLILDYDEFIDRRVTERLYPRY
jgi:hypothetical protein